MARCTNVPRLGHLAPLLGTRSGDCESHQKELKKDKQNDYEKRGKGSAETFCKNKDE